MTKQAPKKQPTKKGEAIKSEHLEQVDVRKWYDERFKDRLLYSVPNGAFLGGGRAKSMVASKLLNEGMRPGVPDLCLAKARGGYHGLYIEMKRTKKSSTSQAQTRYHEALRAEGYRVEVCKGAEAAISVLAEYLGLEQVF